MSDSKLLEAIVAPIMMLFGVILFILNGIGHIFLIIFSRERIKLIHKMLEHFITALMFLLLFPLIFYTALKEMKEDFFS